jgi:CubicO group peptidase (beta-lactamase class C family)
MRHILTFLLAFLTLASSALAQTSDGVDAFLAQQMARSNAPGLAYAVVDEAGIALDAFGVMQMGENAPITPHTLFRIGSVSKSFTALAIMQLKEEGALSLEDEVALHLPAFDAQSAITLRQLLSHTSGYSTVQGNTARSEQSLSERAAQLAADGPAQAPGSGWAYSNANYQILGAVIEAVSGEAYADYVTTHILSPLGMTGSRVLTGSPVEGLATGHQPFFFGRRPVEQGWGDAVTAPAGGVVSSAADMALYLSMMLNGEDDLVPAASKMQMLQPASDSSPYYGLGWALDPEGGYALHTGLTPGFEAIAVLEPAQRRGVVVLVNASGGMGFSEVYPLLYGVTNLALGEPYEGAGADWGPKSLYLLFALMPLAYLAASIGALTLRDGLRAKSGLFGQISLWLPLVMSGVLAVVLLKVVPGLFGTTLGGLALYQPDLVILLYASVILSAIWAVLRLVIAHTGKRA